MILQARGRSRVKTGADARRRVEWAPVVYSPQDGPLAQAVEHLPFKQRVAGSSPARLTFHPAAVSFERKPLQFAAREKSPMLNVAKRRAVAAIFAVSVCLGQSGFDLLNAVPAPGAEEDEKKSDASSLVNPQMIPESRTLPVFPLRPQMEGVGAQVILGATILRNGSVADITVERVHLGFADGRTRDILNALLEDDFGFGEAAKAAVEQWKYRPALRSGEPVDARIKVVVDFVAKAGTPAAEETKYCGA